MSSIQENTVSGGQETLLAKKATGTKEWASRNVNIQRGCLNNCKYCYGCAMGVQYGRETADSWGKPSIRVKAVTKGYRKTDGTIMFPTTHDICPDNLEQCLVVLRKLLAAGNKVLIVSKPWLACIKALCEELGAYKGQILFRFTIGSMDNKVLSFWEPGASEFKERLASLEWAFKQGFKTSVSCEPMLDEHIDRVVEAVRPFITDSVWIGRANRLKGIIAMNCPGDEEAKERAEKLIDLMNDAFIQRLYERFKSDPMIKWKDSIKEVIGLARPTEAGLDV